MPQERRLRPARFAARFAWKLLLPFLGWPSVLTAGEPPAPLFEEGLKHHEAGRLDEARSAYQKVLKLDPEYERARINLGIVETLLKRPKAGLAMCEQAAVREPGASKAHYCIGISKARLGDEEGAALALSKSIELFREDPVPKIELAHIRRKQKRFKEAVELYRDAVRKRPDDPDLHVHLGYCYKGLEDWVAAEVEYRKAVQKDEKSYFGHLNLGFVLARQRKDKEAQPHYERASELDPKAAEPNFNLGNLFRRAGELPPAKERFRRAVELAPIEPEYRLELARTLWRLGERGPAELELQRAKELKAPESMQRAIAILLEQIKKQPHAPSEVNADPTPGKAVESAAPERTPSR